MTPQKRDAAPDPFSLTNDGEATVNKIRQMLHSKGLTLYRASERSRTRYPGQRAYHIRRNFYFQLRSGLSPTYEQILALHELTGIAVKDWLAAFGFSLCAIPQLQSLLSRPRTALIDDELADPETSLPLLHYRRPRGTWNSTEPLSRLVERMGASPASTLLGRARHDFLYAKVGTEDIFAFPELAPGSIVRINPHLVSSLLPKSSGDQSRSHFLVETSHGLHCARVRTAGPNRVALVFPGQPFFTAGLSIGRDIQIYGVVDFELRSRTAGRTRRRPTPSFAPPVFPETWQPIPHEVNGNPGEFLRRARIRAGLSFRLASEMSREIANALGDSRYFAATGTLSDYEASHNLPRHFHKLLTVSILYGARLKELSRSYGIRVDLSFPPDTSERMTKQDQIPNLLEDLVNEFGEFPPFLATALPALAGFARLSLRDIFWIREETRLHHPVLRGALFAVVNRRSKRPRFFRNCPFHEQPLYILQERNEPYLLASCSIEQGRLTLHTGFGQAHHVDAELIGQVVAIVRSLRRAI